MDRLLASELGRLPAEVARPRYPRARLRPRLVHVGVGAFHRCHQAEYLDDLANESESDWGIVGVNIRGPDVLPTLAEQDGLYTRVLRDGSGEDYRVVGSIVATVPAGDNRNAVEALSTAEVRVATFTVTEKGYCHVAATGEPDPSQADLVHDIEQPDEVPRSLPGVVTAALDERRRQGRPGISLISCDNVPGNGRVLERMVRAVAEHRSPALSDWIDAQVGFVSTMVDRIVPATHPGEPERVAAVTGLVDRAPVIGEPFRQWVLSDTFRGPRPRLEDVGADLSTTVDAYEILKMRMVNGAQSMLAYLGALAGHEYIRDAVADERLRELVETQLAEEVQPGLPPVALDVDRYRESVLDRLANPAIGHTTHQIATDGSRKIVPRFLEPIRSARAERRPCGILLLGVAAWIRYQEGVDDAGLSFEVDDPAHGSIATVIERAGPAAEHVTAAVLAREEVFGSLGRDRAVVEGVARHLLSLREHGTSTTVAQALTGEGGGESPVGRASR